MAAPFHFDRTVREITEAERERERGTACAKKKKQIVSSYPASYSIDRVAV